LILCAARRRRGRDGGGSSIEAATITQPVQDGEFQVLFAEPELGAGPAAQTVMDRLADRGLRVITTRTREGLRSTIAVHGRSGPGSGTQSAAGSGGSGGAGAGADSMGRLGAGGGTMASPAAGPGARGGPAGAWGAGTQGTGGIPGTPGTPPTGVIPIGAAVLSWELFGTADELSAVLDDIHRLSAPPPVVVLSEADGDDTLPERLAARAAGSFWLRADSPHFVADQVEWLVKTFALRSQVLGALAASGPADQGPAGMQAGTGRGEA